MKSLSPKLIILKWLIQQLIENLFYLLYKLYQMKDNLKFKNISKNLGKILIELIHTRKLNKVIIWGGIIILLILGPRESVEISPELGI